MKISSLTNPLTVDGTVVILPIQDYESLLKEAGYQSTPALDKRITQARSRFRKGKSLKWEKVRNEFV